MKISKSLLLTIFIIFSMSCEDLDDPFLKQESGLMTLTPSNTSVGVGLNTAINITMATTKDAAGEICTFTTNVGSFSSSELQQTKEITVDIDGKATAFWFPPELTGKANINATIKTVSRQTEINVEPVTSITITELPSTLTLNEKKLFKINIPQQWAGEAIEVRAVQAILQATGQVKDNLDLGSRILPIAGADGSVEIIITAPETPSTVILTVSLFGTSVSQLISINE